MFAVSLWFCFHFGNRFSTRRKNILFLSEVSIVLSDSILAWANMEYPARVFFFRSKPQIKILSAKRDGVKNSRLCCLLSCQFIKMASVAGLICTCSSNGFSYHLLWSTRAPKYALKTKSYFYSLRKCLSNRETDRFHSSEWQVWEKSDRKCNERHQRFLKYAIVFFRHVDLP